jgi:hypothetical protein
MDGEKSARVRVEIGSEWKLEDLYAFARDYEDLYAFIFHFREALEHRELPGVGELFERVPKSGFGALNFFAGLRYLVPGEFKPSVRAIEYGSPGFLDLQHAEGIAVIIGVVVQVYLALRGGGPPAPPSPGGGVSINVTNSSNVNIIVNALSREDAEQPQVREVIAHRLQREAILQTVRNKVRRLSEMWRRGQVTGLTEHSSNDDKLPN